jgi:uncharacterized protein YbcI
MRQVFGGVPSGFGVALSPRASGLRSRDSIKGRKEPRVSMDEQQQTERPESQEKLPVQMHISNEMVRLYKEQFGRGPTKARTNWAGPDVVVTVLEDTLTPAERNLVKLGEHQRLRDLRMFFQYAAVAEFCEPVERLTGRKVRAFHSSIDTKADGMAVELFVLHPEGYAGASRASDLAG